MPGPFEARALLTSSAVSPRERCLATAMLFLSVTTSCASPTAKLTKELEGARSWMATGEMVADRWAANRVPSRYARRSLDEALTALRSSDRALASADANRAAASAARPHIARARQVTDSLLSLIAANDRRTVPATIGLLARERQALDSVIAKASQ